MSSPVSSLGAYLILYTVLLTFTLLAVIAGFPYLSSRLPPSLRSLFTLNSKSSLSSSCSSNDETDHYLSARGSANTTTITLSFFASGMGAWVLYGTTEMGATPSLSWWGVLGYSFSSALPAVLIIILSPKVLEISGDKPFSSADFARKRYGKIMQGCVIIISVVYMYIGLVSELTSVSNIFGLLTGVDIYSNDTKTYTTSIAVTICVFTGFYSSAAGLPASIVTDRFQAGIMIILILVLFISITTNESNHVTVQEFKHISHWTHEGFQAMISLIIAISAAEMFNQGNWQRVYAASSRKSLKWGFGIGSCMVFALMLFFGVVGMISIAKDPTAYESGTKYPYLAFFDILSRMPNAWNYLTLILVTSLCASTVDTLQNALISVFSSPLQNTPYLSDKAKAILPRVLLVLVNVPAVIMSAKRTDVLTLLLVVDLVCCTSVFPVFLGLHSKPFTTPFLSKILPPPTQLGAFFGILSGILTVVVNGMIIGFNEAVDPFTGEVLASGPFAYFWLTNGAECTLCGGKTMVTFIVTPLFSIIGTYFFSRVDLMVSGDEKAREGEGEEEIRFLKVSGEEEEGERSDDL